MVADLIKIWVYLLILGGTLALVFWVSVASPTPGPKASPDLANVETEKETPGEGVALTPGVPVSERVTEEESEEKAGESVIEEPFSPPPPLRLCALSENDDFSSTLASVSHTLEGMWKISSDVQMPRAITAGKVVKRFNSPFSGDTIYLRETAGRLVFLYGGLAFEEHIKEGAELSCGAILGRSPEDTWFFAAYSLERGKSWWEGTPLDLADLTRLWQEAGE